jgi:hypothetical protein
MDGTWDHRSGTSTAIGHIPVRALEVLRSIPDPEPCEGFAPAVN